MIALGVVLGGSLAGSLAALFTGELPLRAMVKLASELKIWALVTALGGTFTAIRSLETGILERQPGTLARQLAFILAAFAGAHLGWYLLTTLGGGE